MDKILLTQVETDNSNTEIQEMLQKKSGRDCRPKERMSKSDHKHLFIRPKKDGESRPIFNLKQLNDFVIYEHFKMEDFQVVKHKNEMSKRYKVRPHYNLVKLDH